MSLSQDEIDARLAAFREGRKRGQQERSSPDAAAHLQRTPTDDLVARLESLEAATQRFDELERQLVDTQLAVEEIRRALRAMMEHLR